MAKAFLAVTILFALITAYSGVLKVRRDARVIGIIHGTIGVPMAYMNLLAACEFAGAAGLILGIWYRPLGIAAGIGLVIYFIGAVVSHLRVGDVKGIGNAVVMLVMAAASLTLRVITR
jgi:hypothetical protein